MDKVTYNGEQYSRLDSGQWVDSRRMLVHAKLQSELSRHYIQTLDFSKYSTKELIDEGDRFKKSNTYDYAIAFYEEAIQRCKAGGWAYILPRITSCYRQLNVPGKAVELFSQAKEKYGEEFITPVLLTSVAAAYCDMKQYENALRCCKWAYKRYNSEENEKLQSVFRRIKKESGLE